MPKVPRYVIDEMRENAHWWPLDPLHGWRSSPDEGGHTHCLSCKFTLYRGDLVVSRYLEYVSITFCPDCVADNPELFREWISRGPG